jgi:hypothetical protein
MLTLLAKLLCHMLLSHHLAAILMVPLTNASVPIALALTLLHLLASLISPLPFPGINAF